MIALSDKMRALQARLEAADARERLSGLATLGALSMELPALVIVLEEAATALQLWVDQFGEAVDYSDDMEPVNSAQAILKRISERLT